MKCEKCKHWRRLPVYVDAKDANEPSMFGTCERSRGETFALSEGGPVGEQLYPADVEAIGVRNAVAADGDGYFAVLITREGFGCVDFERAAERKEAG